VVQGTSEDAAFRIIKNGFGTVASLDDGWYGRGMYFTTHAGYAAAYARPSPHGKVFVIALVIPGNAFPVVESPEDAGSLHGQACTKGYQSHYLQVRADGMPVSQSSDTAADELVVFEGWQTLPLFLVYTDEFTFAPKVSKMWDFLGKSLNEKEGKRVPHLMI